jgi:murein hydrolase activator
MADRGRRAGRAALLLGLLLAGFSAAAEDPAPPAEQLRTIEKALDESRQSQGRYAAEASALAAEIAELRGASVKAAQVAQETEAAMTDLEQQLARLQESEAEKSAALRRRGTQSEALLMALQRLARQPPEAMALAPGEPVDTVRAGLLISAAIPAIEAQARRLKEELAGLGELRGRIAEKRQALARQSVTLASQELALKTLAARKSLLLDSAAHGAELSAQRLAQLSSQAGDLRELIERLEAEQKKRLEEERRSEAELLARAAARPPRRAAAREAAPGVEAPPPGDAKLALVPADPARPKELRPFSAAHGAMLLPVSGKLRLRFGENDEFGAASKGLLIEARPGGQVVAPFDGRVEFAGPFRGYGQILIIEHGDGYHSLLAGLERIDSAVGRWLVAGEPVGIMPAGGREPALYLELRRHGQPINPLPWLATRDDKVNG